MVRKHWINGGGFLPFDQKVKHNPKIMKYAVLTLLLGFGILFIGCTSQNQDTSETITTEDSVAMAMEQLLQKICSIWAYRQPGSS